MYQFGEYDAGYAVFDPNGDPIESLAFIGEHAGTTAARLAALLNLPNITFDPNTMLTRQTFTANGTFTWPAGVTSAFCHIWSGGAGAGASASGEGGGGGGGYANGVLQKTAASVTVNVAAAVAVNTNGNPSSLVQNSVTEATLDGGTKGSARTGGSGGGAGVYSANFTLGDNFFGGAGGTSIGAGNDGGGGGGGSAGSGSNGGDGGQPTGVSNVTGGVAGTAGTGTYPGAAGGAGGDDGVAGNAGSIPGGGGGGGGAGANGAGGQRGEVWIEYQLPVPRAMFNQRLRRA